MREDARKNFKHQPYQTVSGTQYIAQKDEIGGDADGKSDETFNTDILNT